MFRKTILCALAGAATMMTGAAVAKPGGGPGGGGGHGMGALHANAHGLAVAPHGHGVRPAGIGRVHSQGPYHASPTGISHSNSHSVLKGTTVVGGSIAGLTRGMSVLDVNGNPVGTVSRINTASGGRVVNVLVKSSTGARTIPLSPNTLSVSGGVATTTSLRRHTK
jgi:hypothetical protein